MSLFVLSESVRGAAREVARGGVNEALGINDDHRPIY